MTEKSPPDANGTPIELVAGPEEAAAVTGVEFPLCDAAIRKLARDLWELADAVVLECSDPGPDGVRNESYAKINAMRREMAQNHGFALSFERVRKLRQVAAAFPAGRRRPGMSFEVHLEAGSPEALDDIINRIPADVAVTRARVRSLKKSEEASGKEDRGAERGRQIADQRIALQNVCLDLERQRDRWQAQYIAICHELGREPEPIDRPKEAPSTSRAEGLDQSLRAVLMARGFDPATADVTVAIDRLVQTALAQQ
jgi:hypothetical protein